MKKTFKFSKFAVANEKIKNNEITITIELKDSEKGKTFSACGSVWDGKHTDIIMGGQCIDDLGQYLKNNKTYLTSEAVDKSYGLNFTCRREAVDSKSRQARLIYCYGFTPYGAITLLREFEQDNHVVRWSYDSCL